MMAVRSRGGKCGLQTRRARCWLKLLLVHALVAVVAPTEPGSSGEEGAVHRGSAEQKYYLAIGAVFRDEDIYLAEWLEFHICAGVEHFFLYNHQSSTEDHVGILQPYIDSGLVTLDQAICDGHCQTPTYEKCIHEHGRSTRWIAFIDLDEFLFPASPSQFSLPDTLGPYESAGGGVCVHWVVYGSSNRTQPHSGLVIDAFTKRSPGDGAVHSVIKTIAQPAKTRFVGAHNHVYEDGWDAVNERFERIQFNSSSGEPSSALPSPSASVLRINHYRLKSLSHTHWRFKRDSTFRLNDFDNPEVFPESEEEQREWIARWDACCEEDDSALKYRTCIDEGMKARARSREAYNRAGEL